MNSTKILRGLGIALLTGALSAPVLFALDYLQNINIKHPAIQYFQAPVENRADQLMKQLQSGEAKLEAKPGQPGYLPAVLEKFGINVDSQIMPFAKTSFQAMKISPTNPRAIYFTDDVAVAYVRDGVGLEVAALDAKQGVVFYTINDKEGKPVMQREQVCLQCHQGPATFGVPGFFVGSVFPNPLGQVHPVDAIITDQRTKFEERYGGWYVNARRGEQVDRANSVASDPAQPDVLDTLGHQNLKNLMGRFNPNGYLAAVSDIVALITFEHQTQMVNYITRLGWDWRIAESDGKLGDEFVSNTLDQDVENLVMYMLFAEEQPMKEPIEGVSTFTKTFPERGPRDKKGRSLRDFDLQTRTFKYPLSYMIYSKAFDSLPDPARDRVYRRLYQVLSAKESGEAYAKLSKSDRRAILEILRDTKPGLPEYFR